MGVTPLKDRGVNLSRLTDKQRLFYEYYIKDPNATRSAIAAGYSKATAAAQGAKLLKNPLIVAAIGKGTKQILEEQKLEATDVIRQLFCLLTRDIADCVTTSGTIKNVHDIPYNTRMAIDGIETDTYFDEEGLEHTKVKLKLSPKATAVDMALKHKGLYAAIQSENKLTIDWGQLLKPIDRDEEEENDLVEQRILNLE